MTVLLTVDGLDVCFQETVHALRGVSFTLGKGESLAVVGETGAGKSTLALSLVGLVQPPSASGSIELDGQELVGASPDELRAVRWRKVAISLQGLPFNPVARISDQIAEPMREHLGMSASNARRRTEELATEALLPAPLLDRYPHELSRGERRRAALAMALALDPELLVLDEPTAGIDPPAKSALCRRIAELQAERGFALVVITHDLSDASRLASRCLVLYGGEVMEDGPSDAVLTRPAHPYTWALVNSYPVMSTTKDLRPIGGAPPNPRAVPTGCPFHPRCSQAEAICTEQRVRLAPSRGREVACHFGGLKTLLSARTVSKSFGSVRALDEVSFEAQHGEAVGIIGPSGSGKTTLARILCGHLEADSGEVLLEGTALPRSWGRRERSIRRRIQLLMQDPWDALSPRLTVEQLVREPLDLSVPPDAEPEAMVQAMLERVGLPSSGSFLQARTHQLSGGQLQRIALARALITRPKMLVADEPTAMLDPSEQARVLVVLRELQAEEGLTLVLISHDMAVVRKVTDRIVVLDGGRVVEDGPSSDVSSIPRTETARRLVDAAGHLNRPSAVATTPDADRSGTS